MTGPLLWVLFWAHRPLAVLSPQAVTSPVFGVCLRTLVFLAGNFLRALLREGVTVRIRRRQLINGHVWEQTWNYVKGGL